MKVILLVFVMVSTVFAASPDLIKEEAMSDNGLLNSDLFENIRQGTMVDSAGGQYTLALQNHECISYNSFVDAIAITNRNFNPTGILNVHTAPGDLSFWVHDYNVYNQTLGPGRIPTAIAGSSGPYISFPCLYSGAWGIAGAQFCSGGWFSQFWDSPVDLGPGDQKCQTVIGKELSDSNMCFLLYSTDPWGLQYRTYNDSLTTLLNSGGVTPTPRYYWGWDYNVTAGIGYVFYIDPSWNVYYKTTTDGINWSSEQMYNIVWPNPYANNITYLHNGCQAVVTDNGNPLLVFANMNGDNLEYPQDGKIYVCHTEGQPCVEVSNPSDPKNFYPTISTAGNYVAVTYLEPRDAQMDSAAFHDMYATFSTDNGLTWSTPVNETSWSTQRISFPQLAKRFDAGRARAYSVYATCRLPSEDMDLMWAYDNGVSVSIYIMFLYAAVGIEESEVEFPEKIALNVFPNPIVQRSNIRYTIPVSGDISLKLFSVDGRLVKTIEQCHKPAGMHIVSLNTNEFTSGTYFIILECADNTLYKKLVVVR